MNTDRCSKFTRERELPNPATDLASIKRSARVAATPTALVSLALLPVFIATWSAEPQSLPRAIPLNSMLQELQLSPKENLQREQMLRELFVKAGEKRQAIHMMDVFLNGVVVGHNVIVTKPGELKTTIVVGAHVDKVDVGDGVIDDWSGCILVKNLYLAVRDMKLRHTFQFVGFTMEERGLLGSRQFVETIKANKPPDAVAMINFECLGPGGPFIWANGSDDKLRAIAHRVARERKLDLEDHVINGVNADSDPFKRIGVPTITFDGLPVDKFRLIHSADDRFENINAERYQAAYKLGLEFLLALDRELN